MIEAFIIVGAVVLVGCLVAFAAWLTWYASILLAGVCIGVGIGAVVSYVLWQKHKDRDRKERREDLLEFMALVRLGQESRYPSIEDVTFTPPSRARLPARQ